ncbi:MAG: hypothetical protein WB390_19725, partial [Pseudolabrys sp.]
MQAPRQGVLPGLHFIASNFLWFELAAIYHDVGKPDMPPIDHFGALTWFGGTNSRCGHGTPPG